MIRPASRPAAQAIRRPPAQRAVVPRTVATPGRTPNGRPAGYLHRLQTAARTMCAGGFLLLVVLMPPAALLTFIGLIPTVAAWIAETPERRGIALSVGALNVAGVALAVVFFALAGVELGRLPNYLAQPTVWVGMYGAAAIGWGLFLTIPPVVQAAELYRRRQRLADLRRFRRGLVGEWGEEVGGEDGTRSAAGRPRT